MNDSTPHAAFQEAIRPDVAWDLVERYARQKREAPEDVNRGAEILAERLASHGIPVMMHKPKLFLSLPKQASVTAGGQRYFAKPPAFSLPCPEGVSAPMVFVAAPKREFVRQSPLVGDYAGKIVVTEGLGLPTLISEMEQMGAVAVIAVNPGERIHWGTASPIWGTPEVSDLARLPRIPSAAVNRTDGEAILALARNGAVATVTTNLEVGWYEQYLPEVVIPGAVEPDRFVLLHGHYDSWLEGVGDNGTGNACMLEIARVLWAMRKSLRRTVKLAWWPGHSTGRYGGSAWYLDTQAFALNDGCVLQINCDSPGCAWATSYKNITMMPETMRAVTGIVERITGQTPNPTRPNRSSDYTFYNLGLSGAFMASSMMPPELMAEKGWYHVGGCGGNIAWHTEDDADLAVADKTVLAKDIALYLEAVTTFANAEILPLDWRDSVAELHGAAQNYAKAAHGSVDLSPVVLELAELATAVAALHARITEGMLPVRLANDTLMGLSRDLVPLNFARGERFHQDAAVTLPPIPRLSIAEDLADFPVHQRGFAETTLLRGKNTALSAIRSARARVEHALAG